MEKEVTCQNSCGLVVVQWRVDHQVFSGTARSITPTKIFHKASGSVLPPPVVYIRDGTVTLQEREFSHYSREDEYGEFVREGQRKAQEILRRVSSADNRQVFAGSVKSTQLRVFSKLISWYISHGSKLSARSIDGSPIDAEWEKRYSSAISDNQLLTHLLATLVEPIEAKAGIYWTSCIILRQFHSTTEFFSANVLDWDEYFKRRIEQDRTNAEMLARVYELVMVMPVNLFIFNNVLPTTPFP